MENLGNSLQHSVDMLDIRLLIAIPVSSFSIKQRLLIIIIRAKETGYPILLKMCARLFDRSPIFAKLDHIIVITIIINANEPPRQQ